MHTVHVKYSQDSYVLMWTMFPTIYIGGTYRDVMFVVEWSEACWSDCILLRRYINVQHECEIQPQRTTYIKTGCHKHFT